MADKKITELTNITGANLVDADEFVVVDISADETKAITLGELKEAFDSGSGFVRITGDTMTGALDVQSTITADGLTVDGTSPAVATLNSTSNGVRVEFNGASTPASRPWEVGVLNNADGDFQIYQAADAGAGDIKFYTDGALRQNIDAQTGDISFYEDTGTTPKMVWKSADERLGIGIDSPSRDLHINGTSSNAKAFTRYTHDGLASTGLDVGYSSGGYASLYNAENTAMVFSTNATERLRITSAGSVGIGTSSPSSYNSAGDNLVIAETSGGAGLTLASSTSGSGHILFADGTSGTGAYDGFIRFDHTTSSMRFATGSGVERLRIDSSGNVGIGTSSPVSKLHVSGNITIDNTSNAPYLDFVENGDTGDSKARIAMDQVSGTAGQLLFYTEGSGTLAERMRIDSSGNLLVGSTNNSPATNNVAGSSHGSLGNIQASVDGNPCLFVNRKSNNGDIISFRKDGSTAGSIGVSGGSSNELYIYATAGKGILLNNNGLLAGTSSGGGSDNTTDLGQSDVRFKDLYLSGSIEIENGTGNVGVGKQALNSNTASNNTAVGYQAGYSNTTSPSNVFIGNLAGYSNTSNFGSNTFVGKSAGYSTTGYSNTFIGGDASTGLGAGYYMSTGNNNTILGGYNGNEGGLDIRTSSNNIVLSDGNGNPRLYIDSAGDCKIGGGNTSQGYQADGLTAFANGETTLVRDGNPPVTITRKSTAGFAVVFYNTTTLSGTISVNGSSTSYNTSSDHRLKENVVDLTGATTRLKQLEPKRFNFIADADTTVDGFLAHEVQSVVPEAITGTKDEVDADGNPVYQGIDQSKLVPLLVATIQELEARITALESL